MKQPTHVDYKKNLPSTHPAYIRRMLVSSTGWIRKVCDGSKQSKAQLSDDKPYRILVIQPEEKRPLGKLAADGKIILKSAVQVSWSESI
jgi:hypothetical protein